ncbi:inter-alpha-trypsin inhibitor heavy chain H3-like [Carcharodon carcharias]|uniref:inter-alpha-trypsin inhibitor heavy chain H3-like n=1 Tax=Carcharodon carcharias TaxID=13397 RepID=UPI001B7E044B|nr:inter-alpha-trypsin inhibitor heavy chain H3-like [Carcharodon carcharias]
MGLRTKLALLRILGDMNIKDHFTIISFDSTIEKWKDSLVQATPENTLQAKRYIIYLQLEAEANINDSLLLAVNFLNAAHKQKQLPERSASMIILLTDGDPNVGEKDAVKIQINVKNAIWARYSLYCLSFGFDIDYSFLEKMALDNGGVARLIYDDSDLALQLQGFYNEVANPLLLDVELQYQENAISELTEVNFKQYYDGSEIVVAGKISDNSLDVFIVEITAQTASSNLFLEGKVNMSEAESILQYQQYIFADFTERLWAYLTIQQLLKQRISASAEEKKILMDRALELSLKYSYVTPLTSVVVTKPEEEKMDVILMADKPIENVDGDPHFIIQLPKQSVAICFNIGGTPGSMVNLVTDLHTGIKINGQLIGDKKAENNQKLKTYFGKFGLENKKLNMKIVVTTEVITIYCSEEKIIIPWSTTATLTYESFSVSVMKEKNLTVTMGDGATFIIVLHRVWKKHPLHRDFLGFYTLDSHRLSKMAHGLLSM